MVNGRADIPKDIMKGNPLAANLPRGQALWSFCEQGKNNKFLSFNLAIMSNLQNHVKLSGLMEMVTWQDGATMSVLNEHQRCLP